MRNWLLPVLLLTFSTFSYGQDGYLDDSPSIAYWKVGDEEPIVIILHGGPSAQHQYLRPEFDALSQVATLIYYDQRGAGKSERADSYVWQEHVHDLRRIVKAFSNDRKVFLAGSSWGSTLAIMYAYTYPEEVKGLILSGTYPWEGKGEPYVRQDRFLHYPSHKQKLKEFRLQVDTTAEGLVNSNLISKEIELSSGAPLSETRASIRSFPVMDSLSKINIPVLVFASEPECGIDWGRRYAKVLPRAELFIIPSSCHDPWFTHPSPFFTKSIRFIGEINKAR